ncbi:hypothetical protein ACS72_10205, partial [Acinetobacter sp. VT 511]
MGDLTFARDADGLAHLAAGRGEDDVARHEPFDLDAADLFVRHGAPSAQVVEIERSSESAANHSALCDVEEAGLLADRADPENLENAGSALPCLDLHHIAFVNAHIFERIKTLDRPVLDFEEWTSFTDTDDSA